MDHRFNSHWEEICYIFCLLPPNKIRYQSLLVDTIRMVAKEHGHERKLAELLQEKLGIANRTLVDFSSVSTFD